MSDYYYLVSGLADLLKANVLVPVSMRSDLFLLENEQVPLLLVAPSVEAETIRMKTFNKNVVYNYRVRVALVVQGNRIVGENLQGYLDQREQIRDAIYQLGADPLVRAWDVDYTSDSVSKFAATLGTNYKVTGWDVVYSVNAVREGV